MRNTLLSGERYICKIGVGRLKYGVKRRLIIIDICRYDDDDNERKKNEETNRSPSNE